MSEQTVQILIRLLLRSSLIRIYTVCHSFYIFWRHYFIVKLNCFILRTTTVAGLGVPIFRVFMVHFLTQMEIDSNKNNDASLGALPAGSAAKPKSSTEQHLSPTGAQAETGDWQSVVPPVSKLSVKLVFGHPWK